MPDAYTLVAAALDCPVDSLSPASALGIHPQWDSFGHINVMLALQGVFGIDINDETMRRYQEMAGIVALFGEQSVSGAPAVTAAGG